MYVCGRQLESTGTYRVELVFTRLSTRVVKIGSEGVDLLFRNLRYVPGLLNYIGATMYKSGKDSERRYIRARSTAADAGYLSGIAGRESNANCAPSPHWCPRLHMCLCSAIQADESWSSAACVKGGYCCTRRRCQRTSPRWHAFCGHVTLSTWEESHIRVDMGNHVSQSGPWRTVKVGHFSHG